MVVGIGTTATTEVTRGSGIGDDMVEVVLEGGETVLRLLLEAAIPSRMLEYCIASSGFHTFEYVKTHGNCVGGVVLLDPQIGAERHIRDTGTGFLTAARAVADHAGCVGQGAVGSDSSSRRTCRLVRWRRVDDSRGWVFDILSELCVQFVIGVSHLASEIERDGVVGELGVGMGKVVGAELCV